LSGRAVAHDDASQRDGRFHETTHETAMTIQEILQELDGEIAATRRALERVPNDRLAWRPHEKSLSLGQLAYHVASLPGVIAEIATQDTFDVEQPIPRPSVQEAAEATLILERSLARAKELIGAMRDADLGLPWRMVTSAGVEVGAVPRSVVIRSILLNHWYHHRGQLTVYLRQLDVPVPSIYGPSADELPPRG
jgi:uncharacterized damage-inducible protein DinB